MTQNQVSADAVTLATALGWDRDLLAHLLETPALQVEVLDLCAIGSDLRASEPFSKTFEGRVIQELKDHGLGLHTAPPPRPSVTQLIGVVGASIGAVLTTVLALMTTGSLSGDNTTWILGASLLAGLAVAVWELTDLKSLGTVPAP